VPRDPKRIDKILAELGSYWKANPDLRLLQVLLNCIDETVTTPYYVEDTVLVELLRRTYAKVSP